MTQAALCPFCGGCNIASKIITEEVACQLGPSVAYEAIEDHCLSCFEKGDFDGVNDQKRLVALVQSENAYMEAALQRIKAKHGFHHVERALRMPQRTMLRWEEGNYENATIALVRIIDKFPLILYLADNNFELDSGR